MTSYYAKPQSLAVRNLAPLLTEDMTVADVGCSGGYHPIWSQFARYGRLRLDGFDPLVSEMDRLNDAEADPKINYHAAWIMPSDDIPPPRPVLVNGRRPPPPPGSFQARLASTLAQQISGYDQVRERFNAGHEIRYAERALTLDGFYRETGHELVDFMKIDTDGHDYEALRGAAGIIASGQTLGVDIEVRFPGPQRDDANLWRNIDRMLGEAGFSLFHLVPRKYSRAALPRPFLKNVPSASTHGQIRWADALYLRDLGAPDYEQTFGVSFGVQKIIKAICLADIFDLADVAAEIVLKYRDELAAVTDPDRLLTLLTPAIGGKKLSYPTYMQQFRTAAASRAFYSFGREFLGPSPRAKQPPASET